MCVIDFRVGAKNSNPVKDGTQRFHHALPTMFGMCVCGAAHCLEEVIVFTVVIQQNVLRFEIPRKKKKKKRTQHLIEYPKLVSTFFFQNVLHVDLSLHVNQPYYVFLIELLYFLYFLFFFAPEPKQT